MQITVESELRSESKDEDGFWQYGVTVLRTACIAELHAAGCDPDKAVNFSRPWFDENKQAWIIQGTGEKNDS